MSLGGGMSAAQRDAQANQNAIAAQQRQAYQDLMPQYMQAVNNFDQVSGLGSFHPAGYGSSTPAPGGGQQSGQSSVPPGLTQQLFPQLGGYQPPPQSQGQWNWAPPGQQAAAQQPTAAPVDPIFGISTGKSKKSNGMGDAYSDTGGQGDPIPQVNPAQQMGPNPYPAPAGPPKPMSAVPSTTSPTPRPISRQQQFIQSNPGMGSFNPNNSSVQNRQQINQATQANGGVPPTQAGGSNTPPGPWNQQATGGINNQQLGIYNTTPYALMNAQAQDAINHQNYLSQQQFKQQMGDRGLEDSSVLGGGLARMNENANNQYAQFRQQLGMNEIQQAQQNALQQAQLASGQIPQGQQAAVNYGQIYQQALAQQQMQNQLLSQFGQTAGSLYGMSLLPKSNNYYGY